MKTANRLRLYVPPRAAWGDVGPPGRQGSPSSGRAGSTVNPATQAAELANNHKRSNSDNYYEDIDPRFAEVPVGLNHPSLAPSALQPPYRAPGSEIRSTTISGLDGSRSYEDIQEGARSPAESDRSNFTSVSQRGINPRWNGPNGGGYGVPVPRRPVQRPNDLLLNSNPDFQLPGGRGGRIGGRGNTQGPYPG